MTPDEFSRNLGLLTSKDQEVLLESTVSIAGAGADGGLTAERVARMGVKRIRIADPENFDATNINRQFGATAASIGKNKAKAVGEELKRIRPDLDVEVFSEGITKENAKMFVEGANIVLDEIEYTLPEISIVLHQAARDNGQDVLSGLNIGFGVNIFHFSPKGISFEELISTHMSKDGHFNMEALVPNLPQYVSKEVIKSVLNRQIPIPAMSPTVGMVASFVSFYCLGAIIGGWSCPIIPKFLFADMMSQEIKVLDMHSK